MTDTADAPRREDARALQAKLYREIGVAAVAAALLGPARPDAAPPAGRAPEAPSAPAPRRAA